MLGNYEIKKISMADGITLTDIQRYLFQLAEDIEYNLMLVSRKTDPADGTESPEMTEIKEIKDCIKPGAWENIELPISGNYKTYSDSGYNPLKAKKIMNLVELRGILKNKEDVARSSGYRENYICTLPARFIPDSDVYSLQQASGNGTWLLHIKTDGTVYCERHRDGSATAKGEYTKLSAGSWLPIEISYSVEE